jgi:uncharacterized protein YqhQ
LQKLSTVEPNDGQIEVAIKSMELVLKHEGLLPDDGCADIEGDEGTDTAE